MKVDHGVRDLPQTTGGSGQPPLRRGPAAAGFRETGRVAGDSGGREWETRLELERHRASVLQDEKLSGASSGTLPDATDVLNTTHTGSWWKGVLRVLPPLQTKKTTESFGKCIEDLGNAIQWEGG